MTQSAGVIAALLGTGVLLGSLGVITGIVVHVVNKGETHKEEMLFSPPPFPPNMAPHPPPPPPPRSPHPSPPPPLVQSGRRLFADPGNNAFKLSSREASALSNRPLAR